MRICYIEKEFFEEIDAIAYSYSDYYFYQGFQVCYGIYVTTRDKKRYFDIVYAYNTVSFMDGSKYIRNSHEYEVRTRQAGETVVRQVITDVDTSDQQFDFYSLEYYY